MERTGKYNNPVCCECHNNFPQVYHSCFGHCEQLIKWMSIQAGESVSKVARDSAKAIKEHYDDEDTC